MKILIADDDPVSRTLMSRILGRIGRCEMAEDGLKALEAFRRAWESGDPFDLVCLDIMMPELDGHQTLDSIRLYEDSKGFSDYGRVKVIMVSALGDENTILKSFRAECEGYLVKPIDPVRLAEQLKRLGLLGHRDKSTQNQKS